MSNSSAGKETPNGKEPSRKLVEKNGRSSGQSSPAATFPEVSDKEIESADSPGFEPPPPSETDPTVVEGEETKLKTYLYYEGQIGHKNIHPVPIVEATETEDDGAKSDSGGQKQPSEHATGKTAPSKQQAKESAKSSPAKSIPAKDVAKASAAEKPQTSNVKPTEPGNEHQTVSKAQPDDKEDKSIEFDPKAVHAQRVTFSNDEPEQELTPDDSGDYDILMPQPHQERILKVAPKVRVDTAVNVGVAREIKRIGQSVYPSKLIDGSQQAGGPSKTKEEEPTMKERPTESPQPVQEAKPASPKNDPSSQRFRRRTINVHEVHALHPEESPITAESEPAQETSIIASFASLVEPKHQDSPGWQEQFVDQAMVQLQKSTEIDRSDQQVINQMAATVQKLKSSDGAAAATSILKATATTNGPIIRQSLVEKPVQRSSVQTAASKTKSESSPPIDISWEMSTIRKSKEIDQSNQQVIDQRTVNVQKMKSTDGRSAVATSIEKATATAIGPTTRQSSGIVENSVQRSSVRIATHAAKSESTSPMVIGHEKIAILKSKEIIQSDQYCVDKMAANIQNAKSSDVALVATSIKKTTAATIGPTARQPTGMVGNSVHQSSARIAIPSTKAESKPPTMINYEKAGVLKSKEIVRSDQFIVNKVATNVQKASSSERVTAARSIEKSVATTRSPATRASISAAERSIQRSSIRLATPASKSEPSSPMDINLEKATVRKSRGIDGFGQCTIDKTAVSVQKLKPTDGMAAPTSIEKAIAATKEPITSESMGPVEKPVQRSCVQTAASKTKSESSPPIDISWETSTIQKSKEIGQSNQQVIDQMAASAQKIKSTDGLSVVATSIEKTTATAIGPTTRQSSDIVENSVQRSSVRIATHAAKSESKPPVVIGHEKTAILKVKEIDRSDQFAIDRAAVNVQEMKQSSDGQCMTAVSKVVPTKGPQMREGCGVEKAIQKSSVRVATFATKSETIPPRAIKSERTGTQQAKTKEPVGRQQDSKGDVSKKVVALSSMAPSHRQSPEWKSVDRLAPKAQQMKPSGRTIKLFETESSFASVMTPSAKGETASSEAINSEKVTGRRPRVREEDRPQKVSIGKAALATVEPSHRLSSEQRSVDRVPAPVNRMKQAASEMIKPTCVGKGSADTALITKVHIFDPHLARDPDRLKPTRAKPLRAASADSSFRDSTVQQVVDRAVVRVENVSTSAAPTAQRVSTSKATTQIPHSGKTTPKKPVQGVAHRAHLVKGEMKVASDGPDSKMVGNEVATAVPIKESTFKWASPIAVEKLLLVPAVLTPISTTPVNVPKRAQPKVGDRPKKPVKESGRQKEAPEEAAKESGRPKEPAKPQEVERPAKKVVPIRVERTKPVQPDRSASPVEVSKTPGSKGPAYQEPRTVEKAATQKRTPVKTMPEALEQAPSPKARPSPTEMAKKKEAAVEPETEGPKMVVDIDVVFDVSVFEVSENVNDAANENGVAGGNKAEDQPMIKGADEAGVGGPLPIDFAGKSGSSSQQKPISWMSSHSDGRASPTPDKTEDGKSPGSSTSRSGTPTSRRSELSGRPSSNGKPGTEDEGSSAEEDTRSPRFRSQSTYRRPESGAKYKSIHRSKSDVAPLGNKSQSFPSDEAESEISGWQHSFSGLDVNEFIRKMMKASPGIPIQVVETTTSSKPEFVFIDSSGHVTKSSRKRSG